MKIALFVPLLLVLAGCTSPDCMVQGGQATALAPLAAPSCGCASAALAAPAPRLVGGSNDYVLGAPGAREYAQAGFQIPGNLVICAGNFLRCAVDTLFPTPAPSLQRVQYVQAVQAAPMAAPCAPAPVQIKYVPVVPVAVPEAPKASPCAHPEPPVAAVDDECPGGCCRLARR